MLVKNCIEIKKYIPNYNNTNTMITVADSRHIMNLRNEITLKLLCGFNIKYCFCVCMFLFIF